MSELSKVMLWAVRVTSYNRDAGAHQILEIRIDATLDEAQKAFQDIARIAHPDLHRSTLSAPDLEIVTSAYARAAGAYQDFRSQRMSTTRLRPLTRSPSSAAPRTPSETTRPPSGELPRIPNEKVPTPLGGIPRIDPGARPSGTGAANQMSSKALIYYRKAELSLRRGDLAGAVLQIKMAIAADPQSAFLRTALAEVQAELAKGT